MNGNYKYLFGPVPSRRFGLSLGVDLVPCKTCSLNCVFCEVGPTSCLTLERKQYVPALEVERELRAWRLAGNGADVISVTGSGEPTLHTGFGEILAFIKNEIKIKSVLLTNSSLLFLPEVRRAAAMADIVKATFLAWDEDSFRKMTRPCPGLHFESVLQGLRAFRSEYSGILWLEVFVVAGINSSPEQAGMIAELARTIHPDKIQLNTAVRPTAESRIKAVPAQSLAELCGLFEPKAEVIARFVDQRCFSPSRSAAAQQKTGKTGLPGTGSAGRQIDREAILEMLKRRPCTAEDVSASFRIDVAETRIILKRMAAAKLIGLERRNGNEFFVGIVR